jgi:hypothetical protein
MWSFWTAYCPTLRARKAVSLANWKCFDWPAIEGLAVRGVGCLLENTN